MRTRRQAMFERRHDRLLPLEKFFGRMLRHFGVAAVIATVALALGTFGYRYFEQLSWLDSFLNASMILSAMGPVTPLRTRAGKLFASLYALFSGLVLITIMGVLLTPIAHRLIHTFHLEEAEDARERPRGKGDREPQPRHDSDAQH